MRKIPCGIRAGRSSVAVVLVTGDVVVADVAVELSVADRATGWNTITGVTVDAS